MRIEQFTEADIKDAAQLAYPVWGVGHGAGGRGEEFGLLMCEYIVRYGWYGSPYAFKLTENGKMVGCILAGKITQKNGYNEWLEKHMSTFNSVQREEAEALRLYFDTTGPKVYRQMNAMEDLYLSFFISSVKGGGRMLLSEIVELARQEGYKHLYLWTDSSCDHSYYQHNNFELVSEFNSVEWESDNDDYLTFIYRKTI